MIRLIRFSVNEEGRALFPDAFTFVEHTGENTRTINGKSYALGSAYSMHTDLEAIPQELRLNALDWPGWVGRQVAFEEWRLALLNNGHAFKHDFSGEMLEALASAKTFEEAILELWSGGNDEYKRSLAQTAKWFDISEVELKSNG